MSKGVFLKNEMELSSNKKTIMFDNNNFYSSSNFRYLIESETLIGEDILVNTDHNTPKSDKYFFSKITIIS